MVHIINDIYVRPYAINLIHCSIDQECVIETSKNSKRFPYALLHMLRTHFSCWSNHPFANFTFLHLLSQLWAFRTVSVALVLLFATLKNSLNAVSCSERSGSNSAWQNSQLSAARRLVNDFSPDFNKVSLPLIKLPKNWLSTFLMENSIGKKITFQLLPVFARKTPSLVQGQHISHRHLVLLQQRSNAGGMTTHLAGMAPNPDTVTHGKGTSRPSSCSCWRNKKNALAPECWNPTNSHCLGIHPPA